MEVRDGMRRKCNGLSKFFSHVHFGKNATWKLLWTPFTLFQEHSSFFLWSHNSVKANKIYWNEDQGNRLTLVGKRDQRGLTINHQWSWNLVLRFGSPFFSLFPMNFSPFCLSTSTLTKYITEASPKGFTTAVPLIWNQCYWVPLQRNVVFHFVAIKISPRKRNHKIQIQALYSSLRCYVRAGTSTRRAILLVGPLNFQEVFTVGTQGSSMHWPNSARPTSGMSGQWNTGCRWLEWNARDPSSLQDLVSFNNDLF